MVTSLTSQLAGKSILVVGGAGALGSAALSLFDSLGAYTVSVDLARQPKAAVSLLLREGEGWVDQAQRTRDALGELLRRGEHGNCMNLVWCTAGGWAGGWVGDVDGLEAVDRMWKVNALSSVLAVHLASHTLDGSGLLVLTGAEAALHGTPDMVGYGMSKSATHHLLHSISHEDRPKERILDGCRYSAFCNRHALQQSFHGHRQRGWVGEGGGYCSQGSQLDQPRPTAPQWCHVLSDPIQGSSCMERGWEGSYP
ncbi:unnamed protein product [Discosporangium mesarthrocarpum]